MFVSFYEMIPKGPSIIYIYIYRILPFESPWFSNFKQTILPQTRLCSCQTRGIEDNSTKHNENHSACTCNLMQPEVILPCKNISHKWSQSDSSVCKNMCTHSRASAAQILSRKRKEQWSKNKKDLKQWQRGQTKLSFPKHLGTKSLVRELLQGSFPRSL